MKNTFFADGKGGSKIRSDYRFLVTDDLSITWQGKNLGDAGYDRKEFIDNYRGFNLSGN